MKMVLSIISSANMANLAEYVQYVSPFSTSFDDSELLILPFDIDLSVSIFAGIWYFF